MEDSDDYDVLHAIHDIMATSQSFHSTVRYLGVDSRNQLVALHERNTALALALLRTWMTQETRTSFVMNIPIGRDEFSDPVPVIPTQEQISAATVTELRPAGSDGDVCAICQEHAVSATRIIHCGHSFHGVCIQQWFGMNPRCPVCRYDIRDFQPTNAVNTNVTDFESYANSMYTNGQS